MSFLNAMINLIAMNHQDRYEMVDCCEAVRQSSINGVTYDIPLWLNGGF